MHIRLILIFFILSYKSIQCMNFNIIKISRTNIRSVLSLFNGGNNVIPPTTNSLLDDFNSNNNNLYVTNIKNETILPCEQYDFGLFNKAKNKIDKFNKKKLNKFSFEKWWEKQTTGRSGLLLFLLPTIVMQLRILQTAAPFFFERLSQYLNPLSMIVSILLLKPSGIHYVRWFMLSSIVLGGLHMIVDTYNTGTSWLPIIRCPHPDSYAVVTDASSGLGKELSKLLFKDGYNLILIGNSEEDLLALKSLLLTRHHNNDEDNNNNEIEDSMLYNCNNNIKNQNIISSVISKIKQKVVVVSLYLSENNSQLLSFISSSVKTITKNNNNNNNEYYLKSKQPYVVVEYDKCKLLHDNFTITTTSSTNNFTLSDIINTQAISSTTTSTTNHPLFCSQLQSSHVHNHYTSGNINKYQQQLRRVIPDVQIIACDLCHPLGPLYVYQQLRRLAVDNKIDILINNAAQLSISPLIKESLGVVHDMLEVNIQSAVALTRLLAPQIAKRVEQSRSYRNRIKYNNNNGMKALQPSTTLYNNSSINDNNTLNDNLPLSIDMDIDISSNDDVYGMQSNHLCRGRIMFVSSLAALNPSPTTSVYSASKAFISSFAQSLRRELMPLGVLVTLAHPGPIRNTRLFKRRNNAAENDNNEDYTTNEELQTKQKSLQMYPSLTLPTNMYTNSESNLNNNNDKSSSSSSSYKQEKEEEYIDSNLFSTSPFNHKSILSHENNNNKSLNDIQQLNDNNMNSYSTLPTQMIHPRPFIFAIPGLSMSTEHTAIEIYKALKSGRDAVTPGFFNKIYIHGFIKWLPSPVLATIAKIAWGPTPVWLYKLRYRSVSKNIHNGLSNQKLKLKYIQNHFLTILRSFWYRPVIDYHSIKNKVNLLKPKLNKDSLINIQKSNNKVYYDANIEDDYILEEEEDNNYDDDDDDDNYKNNDVLDNEQVDSSNNNDMDFNDNLFFIDDIRFIQCILQAVPLFIDLKEQ